VGLGGQYAYNVADARHSRRLMEEQRSGPQQGVLDRAMRSRWSPVKRLTPEEYEDMLREKLLAVEASIAIADEEIEKLERLKRESSVVK
jgi:hypothetical protein